MKILIVLLALVLSGCGPSAEEVTYPVLPKELEDCKFYILQQGGLGGYTSIVRCPHSDTSASYLVKSGRSSRMAHTAVVEE
jgi:hypothetical protein